jgi:diacylglycerol kinase family enzyme
LKFAPPRAGEEPSDPDALPPLDVPLPHDDGRWHEMEGDFQLFWACNTSHAAHDMHQCPGAALSGGRWKILVVQRMARLRFLSLFLGALEAGTHVDHPGVTLIECDAFRLEPFGEPPPGVLSLDGERVPYGAVQARVRDSAARIFCL